MGETPHDWDSNWLMVFGRSVTPHQQWELTEPCLATMKAHDLANWLGDIADGKLIRRICFTEPPFSVDRLVHHGVILELNISSYRMEQAKKKKAEDE
ncbi:WapI family immunity protein [Paludibaculum fermentans]|uniref:WapI family immunity protein n=1 Tax=Paludibaculum fermentans TaxID=1473598 RepID=UPI003EBD1428